MYSGEISLNKFNLGWDPIDEKSAHEESGKMNLSVRCK